MNRDHAYWLDILNAINRVQLFAAGLTKDDLGANEKKQSAILYQIIIIGEATKRLSSEFKIANPNVPWKDIAGMRIFWRISMTASISRLSGMLFKGILWN